MYGVICLICYCQWGKNDGVTKWLAPDGFVGSHVAG